jgi:hypothetical protein
MNEPTNAHHPSRPKARPVEKHPWMRPEITQLPRLTDLTLQTGSPIGGGGNTGTGSTVF